MALHLLSTEPTVFFVERGGTLLHVAEVVVENVSEPVEAVLEAKFPSGRRSTKLGKVMSGKSTHHVHVPEVSGPTPVEFILKVNGEVCDRRQTTWRPQRQWEVYIVPITHHDIGYTDMAENVRREYDGFYADVLRFCEETEDWPDPSKHRAEN